MNFTDCCTGESANFPNPPPPPRPTNCCSGNRCSTLTVSSNLVDIDSWNTTVTLDLRGCPNTSTYTLQRSFDGVTWTTVGDFVLPTLTLTDDNSGNDFDISVDTLYYRVQITHLPGCVANCTTSANVAVSKPGCCNLTAIMPSTGAGTLDYDANTRELTFSIFVNSNQASGCFLLDPPASLVITAIGQSVPPMVVTPSAPVQVSATSYRYDYLYENVDPNIGVSFSVSITNLCSNTTSLAGSFTVPGIPACCSTISDNFLLEGSINVVGQSFADNTFNGSANTYNVGGTHYVRTQETSTRYPAVDEETYNVQISYPSVRNCGGNVCRLDIESFLGNIYTGNAGFLSAANNLDYNRDGVITSPYMAALAGEDTFFYWGTGSIHSLPLTNAVPPNNAPYLISFSSTNPTVNASINITTGEFTIPANQSFTLDLVIRVPKELGAGHSPFTRGSYTGLSTTEEQFFNGNYSNMYRIKIVPVNASLPCVVTPIISYARFSNSNQKAGNSVAGPVNGYPLTAKSVSQLMFLEGTPTNIETMLVRERDTPIPSNGCLFNICWRNPFDTLGNTAINNFDRLPYEVGGATNVFSNIQAYQNLTALPFRVNNVGYSPAPAGLRNRMHFLAVNRWQHLLSYSVAKIVEENFNVIFPNSNDGFWNPHNGNGFNAAGTYPAGTYTIDFEFDPIISVLMDPTFGVPSFELSAGFDLTDFKLSVVLFSEAAGNYSAWTSGTNYINRGLSTTGGCFPSGAIVVELSIDLTTGLINSGYVTPVSRIVAYGNANPFTNWRNDYNIGITVGTTNFTLTNTSTIETYLRTTPLKFATQPVQPAGTAYIANNMVLTTMNLCPLPTSGTDYADSGFLCDYTGTVYNALGSSSAFIVNPRIKGEIVARAFDTTIYTDKFHEGIRCYYDNSTIIESRGRFTSPYCSITTPVIKLGVLDYAINGYSGRADFCV